MREVTPLQTLHVNRTVREHYEELYANEFSDSDEMDSFPERHELPKKKNDNPNSHESIQGTELVVEESSQKEFQAQMTSPGSSTRHSGKK